MKVRSKKPKTHILSIIDHLIWGMQMGFLISKLGHDSLFPDKKVKKGEKLPLVAIKQEDDNLQSGHSLKMGEAKPIQPTVVQDASQLQQAQSSKTANQLGLAKANRRNSIR